MYCKGKYKMSSKYALKVTCTTTEDFLTNESLCLSLKRRQLAKPINLSKSYKKKRHQTLSLIFYAFHRVYENILHKLSAE